MGDVIRELGRELQQRIRRVPLREQIAEGLARQVAVGLLKAGDVLPSERELSSSLSVSRESLRGALQLLAERGVVEIGHGTRTRIRDLPSGYVLDQPRLLPCVEGMDDRAVLEARQLLEPELTARAATRLSARQLDRLARLVDDQQEMVRDPVAFQILDREFHRLIFVAAASSALERFAGEAYDHAYVNRRKIMENHDGIPIAIGHHRAILAALRERDPDRAHQAMARHVESILVLLAEVPSSRARRRGE
ncbi:MAG: FadR family transcriptional regulator [Geminicoccaceae bacterium]|nr:FadR family transcriptional regulator [Geminicoccaceae bacterium]MCB9945607.1 FadR family transcriptional regulator [Geminicoccaceae bacterium]